MPHEAKHDEADNAFYAQLDELLGLDAAGLRALALFLNLNKKSPARMTGATKEMERNARHLARAVDFFRPYFTEPEHYLATASQYLTLFKLAKLNREKATGLFAKIRFDYPLYMVDEFVAEQNTRKKRTDKCETCHQAERVAKARHILESMTMRDQEIEGNCPYCGAHDYPVDAQGNKIDKDDVSDAVEWNIDHSGNCPYDIVSAALAELGGPDNAKS